MSTSEKLKTCDELECQLGGFTGTCGYTRFPFSRSSSMTDGIRAMLELANAYWLMSVVDSYIPQIKLSRKLREFALIRLTVNDGKGLFEVMEDTGKKPEITQKFSYTDFPEGVFETYFIDGVWMLKSEY